MRNLKFIIKKNLLICKLKRSSLDWLIRFIVLHLCEIMVVRNILAKNA